MHRKIRAVVMANSLNEAIDLSKKGLENAMDDEILANGTLSTLTGEHTEFRPSNYFKTDKDKAGYPTYTDEGKQMLEESIEHTIEKTNCFLFSVDERNGSLTATPISTENAVNQLRDNIYEKGEETWVVTFDLRYDYDNNPHKDFEILGN